jgi:hypothetical protein
MTMLVDASTQRAGRCRSCERAIVWMLLGNGQWHPFDPPVVIVDTTLEQPSLFAGVGVAAAAARDRLDARRTPSHFSTCPQRGRWQGRR